jgi:preprotein translocase subunit Sec61beta
LPIDRARVVRPAGRVRKVNWKEKRQKVIVAVNDFINQAHGKIKIYPPYFVLIAICVALTVIGEAVAFCCGRICSCCRGRVARKTYTD